MAKWPLPELSKSASNDSGTHELAAAMQGLLRSHLARACGLGLILFSALGATLWVTIGWSNQPPSLGVSREPIFADYAIPLVTDSSQRSYTTTYRAQTAFWRLLPETWRNGADWRLTFAGSAAQPDAVYVEGLKFDLRGSVDSGDSLFYSIPSRLIGTTTSLVVLGSGVGVPNFYLHWNRSYTYPAPPVVGLGGDLLQLDGSPVPVHVAGTRFEMCTPGYSSVIPLIKWCGQSEQVLAVTGSGWAQAQLPVPWPTPQASVSLWVRPVDRGHYNLFTNEDDTMKRLSIDLALDGPGTILVFLSSDGVSRNVIVGTHRLPIGLWSHIALSFGDRTATLFVNGEFDAQIPLDAAVKTTELPVVLGSAFSSPGRYYYSFNGQLAAVRLTSHAIGTQAMRRVFMSDVIKDPNGYFSPGDSISNSFPVSTTTNPWWHEHLTWVAIIVIAYLIGFGFLLAWCIDELRLAFRTLTANVVLASCLLGLVGASIFTTNYDVQLFKGFGEGYWVNGPLPALTISGYGPLVDFLLTVPMLPYIILAQYFGAHSELALNLAIRLPFLLGLLFLLASVSRLTRSVRHKSTPKFPWFLLILNPLVLVTTLWQPEAFLVALVLLSLALLFEGRMIASGIVLGVAFSGKYWPAIVGPIMLIAAWRLFGRQKATTFLAAACSTALGILILYWLPTAILLKSPSDFVGLLVTRTPYFGGAHAAAEATIWSLYALPQQVLPGTLGAVAAATGRYAVVLFVGIYALVLLLCVRGPLTRRKALLATATVLALLPGINSLSVPQFALWSLPLVLLVGADSTRPSVFAWLVVGATWCGMAVFFFSEPISYWLLHVSPQQDLLAYTTGAWLLDHAVNPWLASAFGFLFAALLVWAGANMMAELFASNKAIGDWRRWRSHGLGGVGIVE
jgi:hypothetical protein